MNKQLIHIATENPDRGFERFVEAWEQAKQENFNETEIHLNFEDLSLLLATLTPKRLEVLKTLRQQGPLSVRALSKWLERNYKNVYVDTQALETVGLLERTEAGTLHAPWDVIEAHLSLLA